MSTVATLERSPANLFCSCERPSLFSDIVDGKLCMNCGRPPAPRGTHKTGPVDRGDYYKRHGLIRKVVNGRTVRLKGLAPA